MKKYWMTIVFICFIFLLAGCSSRTRNVATYDEAYDEEMKERYSELDNLLFEKYDNVSDMTKDPLYEEYTRLNMRYGPGAGYGRYADQLQNNFSATVDLNKKIIHYRNEDISYEFEGGQVVIPNNPTDLQNNTLARMVDLAETQYGDAVANNQRVLFTFIWLPLVMLVFGIIGFVNPEWIWYLEGGYLNKNAEPSDLAIVVVRIQSVIFFILVIVLSWMIFRSLL